jgi:hypothetical protein
MVIQLALVLVRLFAIYFFLRILYYVPSALLGVLGGARFDMHSLTVLWQMAICVLLLTYPRVVLIGLKFPKDGEGLDRRQSNAFQSAGIALIGLGFSLYGLQGLVNFQFMQWMSSQGNFGSSGMSSQETAAFWTSVFEIVTGLVLIAMSGGISNLFSWLRDLRPRVDEN